jgi:ribonuclease R
MTAQATICNASLFTVDSEFTKDFDDAFSISTIPNGAEILVAIADPTTKVSPASQIDLSAQEAAATIYTRDHATKKMFPAYISEDESSLLEGVQRNCLLFRIIIGNDLQVIEFTPMIGSVKVVKRLTYKDIPGITADPAHDLHAPIKAGVMLAEALLKGRRLKGALALYDLNQFLLTDEEGNLQQMDSSSDTIGHILVQELMILTNSLAAQYMLKNNIPAVYRNHVAQLAAPPTTDLLQTIETLLQGGGNRELATSKINALVGRARYEATANGHYGLNMMAYMHITSPLRRYPDTMNVRQIKAYLLKSDYVYSQADISAISAKINDTLEARRNATSDHFKSAVTKSAERLINAGKLKAMDSAQLSLALKSIREEDGSLPTELCAEISDRLGKNTLADNVIDRLFFQIDHAAIPENLKNAMSAWLYATPAKAMHLIGFSTQKSYLSEFAVKCTSSKYGFEANAQIKRISDGLIFSGHGKAAKKKEAEQFAAVAVIAQAVGIPTLDTAFDNETSSAPPQTASSVTIAGNPKGALLEMCARAKVSPPIFSMTASGPTHLPSFVCSAKMKFKGADLMAISDPFTSKKTAEADAARLLIIKLEAATEVIACKQPAFMINDSGNPVGDIQEAMQKSGLPLPDYQFLTIKAHPPVFKCSLNVNIKGVVQTFTSTSSSKAEAKKQVAALAFDAMKKGKTQ